MARGGSAPGPSEGLAVVGVEVPLAADRLPLVHQHAVALPKLAVEVLQPQRFAPLGVGGELEHGAEEVAVFADLQLQPGTFHHRLQRLPDAPVARRRHHHTLRRQRRQGRLQLGGQAATVARVVQAPVVKRPAGALQRLREVAHRGQEERDALLARPDVSRLLVDFSHPHRVLRGIEAIEGGRFQVELVAEHDDEGAQARHVPEPGRRAPRQACEQNFTSFQLCAQRLRQVIGRPQAAQGLPGSDRLLPLNADGEARLILAPPCRRPAQTWPGS